MKSGEIQGGCTGLTMPQNPSWHSHVQERNIIVLSGIFPEKICSPKRPYVKIIASILINCLGITWIDGDVPVPPHGPGWNKMILKIPSSSNHSRILYEPANTISGFSLNLQLQDTKNSDQRTPFINNNYSGRGFAYQITEGVNLIHGLGTIRCSEERQKFREYNVIKACPVGTRHPASVVHFFPEARGLRTALKIILSDITPETLILHYMSSLRKNSAGILTQRLEGGRCATY